MVRKVFCCLEVSFDFKHRNVYIAISIFTGISLLIHLYHRALGDIYLHVVYTELILHTPSCCNIYSHYTHTKCVAANILRQKYTPVWVMFAKNYSANLLNYFIKMEIYSVYLWTLFKRRANKLGAAEFHSQRGLVREHWETNNTLLVLAIGFIDNNRNLEKPVSLCCHLNIQCETVTVSVMLIIINTGYIWTFSVNTLRQKFFILCKWLLSHFQLIGDIQHAVNWANRPIFLCGL